MRLRGTDATRAIRLIGWQAVGCFVSFVDWKHDLLSQFDVRRAEVRFLQTLAAMVAAAIQIVSDLAAAGFNTAASCLAAIEEAVRRLLGGGGPAPAEPVGNLEAALPDEGRIEEAKQLERGKAAAAENILTMSTEMQVKLFASASEEDRLQADLSLLSPDQMEWLLDLHDDQLKTIADTSDRRIASALSGEPNAITAIRSVGQPEPDDTTGLAHRLSAKRAATLVAAPVTMSAYMH